MSDVEFRPLPWAPRYMIGSDGSVIGPKGSRLVPVSLPLGHLQVLIYPEGEKRRISGIHRLVCWTYHGPPPSPRHQVAHWDGDPTNNRPENLRWATALENSADRARHGRTHRSAGELDGMAKLRADQVLAIRRLAAAGQKQRDIARDFGITQPTVSNIINRKAWSHLP